MIIYCDDTCAKHGKIGLLLKIDIGSHSPVNNDLFFSAFSLTYIGDKGYHVTPDTEKH